MVIVACLILICICGAAGKLKTPTGAELASECYAVVASSASAHGDKALIAGAVSVLKRQRHVPS